MRGDRRIALKVTGMMDEHAEHDVKVALEKVPGVALAQVHRDKEEALIVVDESVTDTALVTAIEHAGYGARPA